MNRLAELILKKPLDDCSTEELQRITDKYPYFNAGHLLEAAKSNLLNRAKATLYFHPLQLSALFNKSGNIDFNVKDITQNFFTTVTETTIEKQPEIKNNQETVAINEPVQNVLINEEIISTQTEEELITITHHETKIEQETSSLPAPKVQQASQLFASDEVPADIPANELAFEPYHTVDYFASQGIKVKTEDNPPDKFSRQLKSFTEWLKTMKRLPDPTPNIAPKIPSEIKVEQLAATSITDSSIETEAMAEVWIKQGNPEKAIEIYRKLSLLEPSKSPYFASRISALKIN